MSMFAPGTLVRLKNDPARAGQITGASSFKFGRIYWAVRMADGSGEHLFPEGQLEAANDHRDPIAELEAGRVTSPDVLRRLLIHHRLTGRLRDFIYSMDVTDTEFHAYQFKPVLKLLASPSQGLLIADEVGLGKTIEAGLIWTELVARFDANKLLVVCPKSLTEKWRLELWRKFNVDAKIVDAKDLLHYLSREAEGSDGFALIAALPSVRPQKDWEDVGDNSRAKLMQFLSSREGQTPLIDCLIFDEAHHLRNADTASHAFARAAMDVSDFKLLLSATPINLHNEDLRNLLRLLDPETFESGFMFDILLEENRPLVAARELALSSRVSLSELAQAVQEIPAGEVLKTDRQLERLRKELQDPTLEDSPRTRNRVAAQLEEMSLLGSIVNRTRRRDVNEFQVQRRVDHHRWTMSEGERRFYDLMSDVVREHALTLNTSERFLLATPQRLIASSLAAACAHWAGKAADDLLDDPDEDGSAPKPLISRLALACSPGLASELEAGDTKFACLMKAIEQIRRLSTNEKVVVFSSFRVTLDYLARRLRSSGVHAEIMHGNIKEDRTETLARFEAHDGPCVLLTSEVGGEGLDMQFCRALINYDLPWNPMKVEQRIGRLDRIGQNSPWISVTSLICAETIEERIYDRLYRRLLDIQQTLGAFEAILGAELPALELALLDPELTPEEQEREIDRRRQAIITREEQIRQIEEEAVGLIAHGDMILDQIEENHRPERRLAGVELVDYIHEAISNKYPGSRIDEAPGQPGVFDITLSAEAQLQLSQTMGRIGRARTRLSRTNRIQGAFDRVAKLSKSVERITTVHPLTRFAANIRTELARGSDVQPAVCVSVDASQVGLPSGLYVAAVQKWVVDGAVRVDRLAYAAKAIDGSHLDPKDAELLVQESLRSGRPCATDEVAQAAGQSARELIFDVLEPSFDAFVDDENARHQDRAATGLARLAAQRRKRTSDIEWKLSEWKRSGDPKKLRLIPAEQAKLEKLLARLDARSRELTEQLERFSFQHTTVGIVTVRVGDAK